MDLDIRLGEKIGVVGRAGAGRTTLLSSLLRMMEASVRRFSSTVDKDMYAVGLNLFRKSICVISQDAVLFAGTVRYKISVEVMTLTDSFRTNSLAQSRQLERTHRLWWRGPDEQPPGSG